MFALLEAIQLSLKSRDLMPAQNSLHCTAPIHFHGHSRHSKLTSLHCPIHFHGHSRHWHCTDHFIFKANDSIRYHKSDTALTVTRNQTTTTACTRSTHDVTSYLMGYVGPVFYYSPTYTVLRGISVSWVFGSISSINFVACRIVI